MNYDYVGVLSLWSLYAVLMSIYKALIDADPSQTYAGFYGDTTNNIEN